MPVAKSTSRVIYIRVNGDLKHRIKADALQQRRTEAEVVRHILKSHYETQESLPHD